jgi:Multiubiquitin
MPQPPNHGPHQYQIHVDGQHFTVTQSTMTGAQIKALVGKDVQYQLYEEVPGRDDLPIGDSQSVTLRNGQHFYTVPSASFGR